jgi:hypothetical protein
VGEVQQRGGVGDPDAQRARSRAARISACASSSSRLIAGMP